MLWDFSIEIDHPVEANKPDIVVLDKNTRECLIIDVACPFDTRVGGKTKERLSTRT